ncbi:uncharacterized protein LOC122323213 [Puntigrus tetrazona]|uniref:uncharacterized protein LOC122323213 n=1 Tax=Puntigrus tetrazona TaxID=1606681 RepID=UPI001C8AF051|nr:uncharacterized protein LOC122323213 [Puntigrus tetrazona]
MTASPDVESQSAAARPRSRCLDTFLTASVIALFFMFTVAVAGALYFAKHIKDEVNARTTRHEDGVSAALVAPEAGYKMQNFAYLRATESELRTGVMAWETIPYSKGKTIGSLYTYEKSQNVLNIKESGSYFLYVQLNFSCTGICPSGQFSVNFYNQRKNEELTCTVSLPEWKKETPHSRTCWRIVTFPDKNNRLMAKSKAEGDLDNWKLEVNDSGFGMFLVDGLGALRHT